MPKRLTEAELIRSMTVEEIEREYRATNITVDQRARLIRAKAEDKLKELAEQQGYFGAIGSQIVENVNEGWERIKKHAGAEEAFKPGGAAYNDAQVLWGMLQIGLSAANAAGAVTGERVQHWALSNGFSPGAAKAMGVAVDIVVGAALPLGFGVRLGAQTIRAGAKAPKATKPLSESEAARAVSALLDIAAKPATRKAADVDKLFESAVVKMGAEITQERFRRQVNRVAKELSISKDAARQLTTLSNQLGVDVSRLGLAKNATPEQVAAWFKILGPHARQLKSLARAALDGGEPAQAAFAQYVTALFTADFMGGRKIQYSKEFIDMLKAWNPEAVAKGDFVGAMRSLAEDLDALNPRQIRRLLALGQDGFFSYAGMQGVWHGIREVYTNLLLPFSWAPTFLGNSVAVANAVAERAIGAAFSASAQGLSPRSALHFVKGLTFATGDAIRAFSLAFKPLTHGELAFVRRFKYSELMDLTRRTREQLTAMVDPKTGLSRFTADEINLLLDLPARLPVFSRLDVPWGVIPGPVGRVIRTPGDTVRGMDNLFKVLLRRASIYESAMRDGVNAGLTGPALSTFVRRRITHPTEAARAEAEHLATQLTFQSELGFVGNAMRDFLQTGPLYLYFPFMKSPINLVKYSWDRTPVLQLASKKLFDDLRAGGAVADAAVGRLIWSNLLGMFFYEMAKEGLITGSGPVDPRLRAPWRATHEPYSVRTAEGWIPIRRMEPGNTPVGIIADLAQIADHLDELTLEQAAVAAVFAIMENLGDMTWWHGASELLDAVQQVRRGGEIGPAARKALLAPFVTMFTGGPIVARAKQIIDPLLRETDRVTISARSLIDQWTARVPGFSKTHPPVRDMYGDPVIPPQSFGGPWFGLLRPVVPAFREHETDRIKLEGAALQVKSPRFSRHMGGSVRDEFDIREPFPEDRLGVELSAEEFDRRKQIYRALLRSKKIGIEPQLLDTQTYKEATRAWKRESFSSLLSDYWHAAGELLLIERPSVMKRILQSQAKSILPLILEADRPGVERQFTESLRLFETLSEQEKANLLKWGGIE